MHLLKLRNFLKTLSQTIRITISHNYSQTHGSDYVLTKDFNRFMTKKPNLQRKKRFCQYCL